MSSILNLKDKDGNWLAIPSLEGAQGEQGPNLITPETATTLTGLIKGNGSTVEAATPGADYLNYDDIAGRSDSGSNPVLEGVFPGTELAHCILYGKSTQDGTPSPSAPVDIVNYEPDELWVAGRNFADTSIVLDTYPASVSAIPDGIRITINAAGPVFGIKHFELPNAILGKTVTFSAKWNSSVSTNQASMSLGTFNPTDNTKTTISRIDASGSAACVRMPETLTEGHFVTLNLSVSQGTGVNGDYCDFTDIMIVEGEYTAETMPPYTPYQGHTYPLSDLTLPGIPVDEGGNYTDESGQQYIADTYDVATGEYVQRGRELVLDGTEAWAAATTAHRTTYRNDLVVPGVLPSGGHASRGAILSDHYPPGSLSNMDKGDATVAVLPTGYSKISIYDPAYNTSDVSLWKAHLAELYAAGTPVTILYALAEPIVSYRTPQQLPAPAPYTQVMAGGGHIAATLGNAMAPIKTTPQTLTAEQIKQVFINLNIPVPTYEYSDRDLSKVFTADELHAKIAAQDFSGIRMGDYWPILLSGTAHDYATDTDFTINETHLLEFMPNFYAESGDTATPPHILVCSRDLLSKTLQFRSADDVWYDTAATNPWLGSHLYQTLNNPDNGIIKLVRQTDIGQYLYAGPNGKGMRDVLETKAAGATTATGRGWVDRGLLFLPHEREIWGSGPFSEAQDGGYCLQWPTFAGSRKRIVKHRNGSRYDWWSCSSYAGSSTIICYVSSNGGAGNATASSTWLSVPLCFLII